MIARYLSRFRTFPLNRVLQAAQAATAVGLFLVPLGAQAADLGNLKATPVPPPAPAYDFWTSPHLFGDWGGLRTRLHNQGVDFQIGYVTETATNFSGGTNQRVANAGQFTINSTFDMGRIVGDKGGTVTAILSERNGRNLNAMANTGAIMLTDEVYGRGQVVRISELSFNQKLANDALEFRIGRVTVGEDFAIFNCDFINLTFCGGDAGDVRGDFVYNFPIPQWGSRLKANINNFGYAAVGVYDRNTLYLSRSAEYAILPTFPNNSTGALIATSVAWQPTFGRLPGSYEVGFMYDTSKTADVFLNTAGRPLATNPGTSPLMDQGAWLVYANFRQQLTIDPTGADPKHGLSMFLNAIYTDPKTATNDYQIAGGLEYHGPFSWRPNDDIGVAIGTTHVNSRLAQADALANVGYTRTGELATEVFYGYQMTGWLNLKGSLQYVSNPGGYNNFGPYKDLFVGAVRATVDF